MLTRTPIALRDRDRSSDGSRPLRVAIVHEWLERYAGAERVLEQLLAVFPDATLFAVVDVMNERERAFLADRPARTTFIQNLPFARTRFRHYLGLMPLAIEQLDLSGFDVIVSSHHAVAKGVITGPGQLHVCYVHSPMRYAWDLQGQYLRESGLERGPKSWYTRWLLHRLRNWDVRSATGVDVFVANSRYIAERIRKVYRRPSLVVPPPVDTDAFTPVPGTRGHYLVATRLVPYKRVDLIVQAFRQLPDARLIVIGDGPERAKVRAAADGAPNVVLRPPVEHATLIELMRTARGYIHAAEEDFGISMAEAQACGTPVIAYDRGGARDIVRPLGTVAAGDATGVLFPEQTADSIAEAIRRFEADPAACAPAVCRANALRFSNAAFRGRIEEVVAAALDQPSPAGRIAVPQPELDLV